MISKERPRLAEIAEEVADKLIAVHEYRDSAYLRLPVLYPSGSTVVLRLSRERTMTAEPQRFTITDFAAGYDEADMMGTATVFIRHATEIAEREGISWVDHAIVADGLTKEQLFGAAIAVATCSRDAAVVAAERADEGKQTSERDILYRRLTSIFTPSQVHRDVEVVGASNTRWQFTAAVTVASRPTLFEAVSRHPVSVYTATTKFHDLRIMDDAPRRVAVVAKKAELHTLLAVLTQAASVIESDVSNEVYQRLSGGEMNKSSRLH